MKILSLFILLFVSTTLVECVKCRSGDRRLDYSRHWLPLKGKTQLTFLNRAGQPKNFDLHVIDTVDHYVDSICNLPNSVEYIQVTLYLNVQKTDSIWIQLSPPSDLFISAISDSNFNIGIGGFLTGYAGSHGNFMNRLHDYNIGNRVYHEVLLIPHAEGSSNSIDSLFLANDTGIIGFNYYGEKYILQ